MMCGFFGVIDFKDKLLHQDVTDVVDAGDAISYRGPDDSSIYNDERVCISFRRLSIIDLDAPSQPYTNEDGNIIMVCNGEIYNYKELREALILRGHCFKTNTDSEVVVHGYEEWGHEIWEKLNGIFAVALIDKCDRSLYLVRDHLGVKPLLYMRVGNRTYFGSDYNSFKHITNKPLSINDDAILSYLSFRYVVGENTFYKGIYNVLPGNLVKISDVGISKKCYWDIPVDVCDEGRDCEYYLEGLNEKLSVAVKRQLMSDVPVGGFISGGIDSSILLHYIFSNTRDIQTYITGFKEDDYNEFHYADMMAGSLNIVPNKYILDVDEYMDNMAEVISFRGEPVSVPHEAAFLKMARLMKKDISVVLSGEGADELFGGYGRIFRSPFDYYKVKRLRSLPGYKRVLKRLFVGEYDDSIDTVRDHFLWRYSWFNADDKTNMLNKEYFSGKIYDDYSLSYVDELFNRVSGVDYYKAMYYVLGKIHLTNLLNRLDRMTMAASIEARVPFLDYELVEYVSRIPVKYKMRWNGIASMIKALFSNSENISEKYDTTKYILRRLAVGKVPHEIIARKKMGFPVPLSRWIGGKMKSLARELLLDENAKTRNYVNRDAIKKYLMSDKYDARYDYDGKKIWMLMNLEIWMNNTFA